MRKLGSGFLLTAPNGASRGQIVAQLYATPGIGHRRVAYGEQVNDQRPPASSGKVGNVYPTGLARQANARQGEFLRNSLSYVYST